MYNQKNKFNEFIKKNKFFASKKLGQNFLINETIKQKIVDSIDIKKFDNILEIGPGFGSLTKLILEKTKNLTVIELDKRLIEFLKNEFSNLKIISCDILKFDFKTLDYSTYKVISNLPYNISSQIIFKILKFSNFSNAVLMVQKEMAERIVAKVGTKKYNNFTVLLNLTSNIKKLFNVSNSCFFPKPEVESTVIKFSRNKNFDFKNFEILEVFLKNCFSQKRKMIFNNLKKFYEKDKIIKILNKNKIDLSTRPENIEENTYLKMCVDFYEL